MIYGLYLSASGVVASSHRQDVVANNLANAETTGFKRDVPLFQQRLSEAEQRRTSGGPRAWSDANLENIGGGLFVLPSSPDLSAGLMERTDSALDVAIEGDGYFAVRSASQSGFRPTVARRRSARTERSPRTSRPSPASASSTSPTAQS